MPAPIAWCRIRAARNAAAERGYSRGSAAAGRLGYSEIQLLGQTVNSYRDPRPREMSVSWNLLVAVAAVKGIRRVRFTTSHPNDFTREIVEAIDERPELCDHIHLPVQSGSTRILRPCCAPTRASNISKKSTGFAQRGRSHQLDTDIIVGFPGETPAISKTTLTLLDAAITMAFTLSIIRPGPIPPPAPCPTRFPKQRRAAASLF